MYSCLLALSCFCSPADTASWEARLGAESFAVRQRASRDLRQHGSRRLFRKLMTSRDPEVAIRARRVYEDWRGQVLTTLRPYPGLDALWYDTASRHYRYDSYLCSRYRSYLDRTGYCENNANYRWATYCWASDLLDAGLPVCCLRLIVMEMRRRDTIAGYGPDTAFWFGDPGP